MPPFALLHRDGADHVEVLTGDLVTVDTLADIPLDTGGQTLAVIPYRQITERGFDCVDDGAPLECLRITSAETAPLDAFGDHPFEVSGGAFDISDAEYGTVVGDVLRDEIGRGEGANFVIHRVFTASVTGDPLTAARAAFHRLLTREQGAYWTFLVHTGTRTLVGASPERHVSVADGLTMMNPISGTFRHGSGSLLEFLADAKETEELYMVLDEELKMMAAVAEHGGQVVGPYLKQMSRLTHTEYLLAGRGSMDVRDVLRETMFAPTVTGSPIENACRVIARHERRGRGYYGGVLALLGHDDQGRQTLDAPILIRTAEISPAGTLRVPVGATLVRHSTAAGEVAETHTKAAGILAALGLRSAPASGGTPPAVDTPEVQAALAARNVGLARFWLDERRPASTHLAGHRAVIVDNEDTFTAMLAHQLRALGLTVSVVPWNATGPLTADLVVVGPGPGDPRSTTDPKMTFLRGLLSGLLAGGRPTLGVCLGQQMLAGALGLPLHRREAPYQGVARDIDLFGTTRRVGFYSSFTALGSGTTLDTPYGPVEIAGDESDGSLHGLRGPSFAGVQFHPESVLSRDGTAVLEELVTALLIDVVSPSHIG
ncbi:anthranilate synthase family protein [Jidongwangia harbinensis]|uniref:anthranilate synthase family protein n=1 Tax=Jidongwangia harbinensis TaxID=2878561 RepID=UPI001CD92CD3|nr:anthranilate synthase family protein [Jidongwangia harbinensis]MCA2218513.1 anthranilate synthase family protein [Jidongwangia harbinensis]